MMLPGIDLLSCPEMAVPREIMQHVVRVESSHNPYAIGVVGGRLVRQPESLGEALSTVRMLESRGFNFSVGIAQVNRYNLAKYGLASYVQAFQVCPNLQAGARILAECYQRHKNWGKSFSCYYSGNPITGFRHGYVQKVFASIAQERGAGKPVAAAVSDIAVVAKPSRRAVAVEHFPLTGDPRIEASQWRTTPLFPQPPPAVVDPALVGASYRPTPVEGFAVAQPYTDGAVAQTLSAPIPDPVAQPLSGSKRQVQLQPTPGSPTLSPPNAPPKGGDGAFVF